MQDLRVDQPYVVERWPRPHVVPPSSRRALFTAEASLVLVSAAAIFSFTRVFDSWAYVLPVAATALAAHAFGAVVRRRRWRSLVALPVSVVVVAIVSAAGSLRSSIRFDLDEAWSVVNNTRAPVPPTRALALAASLLVGLAVVAADSLAFRRRALFGALVPTRGGVRAHRDVWRRSSPCGRHRVSRCRVGVFRARPSTRISSTGAADG